MKEKKTLQSIIYKNFLKASLIPILVIELTLIILYFGINYYISKQNLQTLLEGAKFNLTEISKKEAKIIDQGLNHITSLSSMLQKEHEAFFKNPDGFGYPNGKPILKTASNKVLYKENKIGSSVYVSSKTKITPENLAKFQKSEMMDVSFKNIVDENENIVAAYFNSWDDFNRLYPFIDDVATQYGEHIHMEDFNFYYLADAKHNPSKKPVWTGAYLDPAGNGWMVSCIVPIYNNDFLEGVTGLDVTIDSLITNVLNLGLPWNAKAFLVDENSQILAMPPNIEKLIGLNVEKKGYEDKAITSTIDQANELNILKNPSVNKEFKNFIKGDKQLDILNIGDTKYMITQKIIPSTNWKLFIIANEDEILESINELKDLTNKIGYYAVALMIIFYILFFLYLLNKSKFLANDIADPIVKLTLYLKNIGSSNQKPAQTYDSAGIAEIDFIAEFSQEIQKVNEEFYNTNKKLEDLNKNLEKRVTQEINKNRQKEAILIQESKMAAMGEMLGSIVHQWKQPLNFINLAISSLTTSYKLGLEVTQEEIAEISEKVTKQIDHLSNTMNDFKNFFKPTPAKEFNISRPITDAFKLTEGIYRKSNIDIIINIQNDAVCFGYPNEITQVFINIFNNARDVILEKNIDIKNIYVDASMQDDYALIKITDCAGGIPENIINKLFEPYFSTKGEKGTGIGLYMSSMIVEKSKGKLYVQNVTKQINGLNYKGAQFIIELPLKKDLI